MTSRPTHQAHHVAADTGGILLGLLSAVAFSTAGFFTRMAPVALCAMVIWRNLFGCAGLALLIVGRSRGWTRGRTWPNARWTAVVLCSALATICYLAAFARTSVADVSVIYATAPLITAALAWAGLGERPATRTLVAAIGAVVGVAVTVAGAAGGGTLAGDALALLMAVALSIVAVLARGAALPPAATALASGLLAALAALPVGFGGGIDVWISLRDALWLAIFGLVTMTVALPAYLAGAARVPAGRAMLISALELPLAPFWVWLAFGEVPSRASTVGGAIVLVAVLLDLTRSRT